MSRGRTLLASSWVLIASIMGGRSAKEEQPGRELIPDYFFNLGHAESTVYLTFMQYVFIPGQPSLLHVAERT